MGRYTYFFATFAILPVIVIAGVVALFTMGKKEPGPTDAAGLEKDMQLYIEIRQKLLDPYDGELWTTYFRAATTSRVEICDFLYDDDLGASSPLQIIDLTKVP